ncbi:MAG: hypothetical protein IJ184_07495, partial [Alphaproteobacteria bacterium]|nr:hypothetical protein [Alphaproteobacteria bacterium]
ANKSALYITAPARISGLTVDYANSAAQGSAIKISNAEVAIDNTKIYASGDRVYGVQVANFAVLNIDSSRDINIEGTYAHKFGRSDYPLCWEGKFATDYAIEQAGDYALQCSACKQFTPTVGLKDDPLVGQGRWYQPAMCELLDLFGIDYASITPSTTVSNGQSGKPINVEDGHVKAIVKTSLEALKKLGVNADTGSSILANIASSTLSSSTKMMYLENVGRQGSGVINGGQNHLIPIISFENRYYDEPIPPEIGDVLYADATYGSTDDYDSSKTAVGVVFWVSEDQASLKAVALKKLTFNSANNDPGNFDYTKPFTNSKAICRWLSTAFEGTANWTPIVNSWYSAIKGRATINVTNEIVDVLE